MAKSIIVLLFIILGSCPDEASSILPNLRRYIAPPPYIGPPPFIPWTSWGCEFGGCGTPTIPPLRRLPRKLKLYHSFC